MPSLDQNGLHFHFPDVEADASFGVRFHRTLRVPDSERDYPLPPGLGAFPVRHVDDFIDRLPQETVERGGVLLPMWQSEALWMSFNCRGWPELPVAVKVAAGKINAVTGEAWRPGLHRSPQDYMVCPHQPWLDGFAVEKGVVRQFVAMPLGEGYSAEEQLTGVAVWGGLQISVTPLNAEKWAEMKRRERKVLRREVDSLVIHPMMALAPGGRIRQSIEEDTFALDDWDVTATQRVFISLVHANDWKRITGEAAPHHPVSAQDYASAGLPWFEWYGRGQESVGGAETLAGLKSVGQLHQEKTGAPLPEASDVSTGPVIALGAGAKRQRPIRTSDTW